MHIVRRPLSQLTVDTLALLSHIKIQQPYRNDKSTWRPPAKHRLSTDFHPSINSRSQQFFKPRERHTHCRSSFRPKVKRSTYPTGSDRNPLGHRQGAASLFNRFLRQSTAPRRQYPTNLNQNPLGDDTSDNQNEIGTRYGFRDNRKMPWGDHPKPPVTLLCPEEHCLRPTATDVFFKPGIGCGRRSPHPDRIHCQTS